MKDKSIDSFYCFCPIHNNKLQGVMVCTIPMNTDAAERKYKQPTTEVGEWCCDTVVQLLLEGKKDEELA